jgi:hypothetical protein
VQPFAECFSSCDSPPPPSSLLFQPFHLDDWGLMYLDYWRGELSRSGAQVISLSLVGLFAAFMCIVSIWRRETVPSPYSIFIRTLSNRTRVLDVLPSDTLGAIKQRLQVR